MATIPGWAYAAVGAAIAIYSKFIQSKTDSGPMKLFFWIGILLLIIGVFKILVSYMTSSKKKLQEGRNPENHGSREERSRPPETRDSLYCPRCNAKLDPRSRFCNWCGTRQ